MPSAALKGKADMTAAEGPVGSAGAGQPAAERLRPGNRGLSLSCNGYGYNESHAVIDSSNANPTKTQQRSRASSGGGNCSSVRGPTSAVPARRGPHDRHRR